MKFDLASYLLGAASVLGLMLLVFIWLLVKSAPEPAPKRSDP